ncbi:flagellar basal body-associated FliL family protein [Marinobacterium mangrovicola]|uniref:Flagellar protein FliL n=1 Tax=Marinobacterium mangrovicola TaxID=1476959 RepID=A0A4R1GDD4_9GAMM|nr:flagellar basal body-associated FliL family protein [Marinobacterium mangrovicola]TCK06094.1 flagellar FliL protein [Marinobacterium mangrovicola]
MFRTLKPLLLTLLFLTAPQLHAEEEGAPYISYIELKPFVTNFGSADDLHFLKAEVTLQVDSEAAHHAVNAHKAQIRNDLVFLFSAQTEESVAGVAAQQLLSGEALKLVQDMLREEEGAPYVADLFFTSFVVQ